MAKKAKNNKSNCSVCEDTGWDFKDKPPPFPKCPKCSPERKKE